MASVSCLRKSATEISCLRPVLRLANRVDRGAEKVRDGHSRDGVRVLKREEQPALRALVGLELDEAVAVEEDVALGDLVGGVTHERVRERALAGAVRPHDGVTSFVSTARSTPFTISVPSSIATCRFFSSSSATGSP